MSNPDPIAEVLALSLALPSQMIFALFDRYGRPLDVQASLDPVVLLSDGAARLGRFSYRAPVDVIANDHFVLERPQQEASAMPGPLFASAIAALTRKNSIVK